jgi:hypothetical protein
MSKRFDPKTITDEELICEIVKLYNKLGRVPSRKDMMNGTDLTKRLYLYGRRFGGLTEACKRAGLVANKGGIDLKYTDKELLDHILVLKNKLGKTPSQKDINNAGKYAIGAYKRHFGTYNNALQKLKLDKNMEFNISKDKIIDDLIRISKMLGRAPKISEFDKYSKTVTHVTVYKKLECKDSWNDVLRKCGLDVINNRNLSDDELKNEIVRLKKELHRTPGYYDMSEFGKYSPETYASRFGTYLKALDHFGFDYTSKSIYKNQIHTSGNDGVVYKSQFEATIANIFFDLRNKGDIKKYEYEKAVCDEKSWTCDFKVTLPSDREIWFEADGMDKNRKRPYHLDNKKIQYYIDNGFNYCIIPYSKNIIEKIIVDAISNNKVYTKDDLIFNNNCKKRKKKWAEDTIYFEETSNISTPTTCHMNEILVRNGHKLTAKYLRTIDEDKRDEAVKDIFNFFKKYDFTNLNYSKSIVDLDLKKITNNNLSIEVIDGVKCISNKDASGNTLCKSIIPNVLNIKSGKNKSVIEVLSDDQKLFKIIRNRVGNTFLYPHHKGGERRQFPFNITPAMIVQGSRSTGYAAHGSMFKPSVAKAIYKYFVKENGIVYDYSAGFGARMLGAFAANKNIKYISVEPNTQTYSGLLKLNKYLGFNADVHNIGSEDYCPNIKVDFVFSSPPYFDHEIYCDEETQSIIKFKKYEDWLEGYWKKTVSNIKSMCHSDTIFGINAGNYNNKKMITIHKDMVSVIEELGFVLHDTWHMRTSRSHFSKNKNDKKEPILFYKLGTIL